MILILSLLNVSRAVKLLKLKILRCFTINILKNVQSVIITFFQKKNWNESSQWNLSIEMFKKFFKNNAANRKNNKFSNLFKINYINNYWIEHEISKKNSNFFIYLNFMNYHEWFIWFTNKFREHSAHSIHEWISWAFNSLNSRMNFVNILFTLLFKKRLYNS